MGGEMGAEERQMELENRIRNLVWTVSGDYTLEVRPDVERFLRAKNAAIYDSVKQAAFAKYLDREQLSLYLVKKVFMQAQEGPLLTVASLCIEEAVSSRLLEEREGVRSIRKRAYGELLDRDFAALSASPLGRLEAAYLRQGLWEQKGQTRQIEGWLSVLRSLEGTRDTKEVIRVIDRLYNETVEPDFPQKKGDLEKVLAVTLEELTEYSWKEFLSEEMYEDNLEVYLERISESMTTLDIREESGGAREDTPEEGPRKILVVDEAALEKMYTYVELNYGRSYLSEQEQKKLNRKLCRGLHGACSLYFTDGILEHPVKKNYQLEYARKLRDKNRLEYYDNHRAVKQNIRILTDMMRRAFALHDQVDRVRSDSGQIAPAQMWKVGRSRDPKLFVREHKENALDFVVDLLIDASGSQRKRQGKVAIQAYTISEALSNLGIPHRVMSFCTFWDYTILQRFRDYGDDRGANMRIFDYMTSANNRDGLAVRAVGAQLLEREEERKILIVLSDGKPYDVVVNRPGNRNPEPYRGESAVRDTASEVRSLRRQGVSVLGIFVGEEQELSAERRIFGKDFAYIRDISGFARTVGRYLIKQIEEP